jgi:long-chain acyl-CoA synthetase
VREPSAPAASILAAHTGQECLTDMVWANADRFGEAISFRRRADHSWRDVTAREFTTQVLGVAKGLIEAGLEPGDRIAILCSTGYERSIVDFAIWTAGCVIVPVPVSASEPQIARMLSQARARAVVVDSGTRYTRLLRTLHQAASVCRVWQIDTDRETRSTMDTLLEHGRAVDDEHAHGRRLGVAAGDPAVVLYPVGPRGRSAGPDRIELSHRDLLGEVRSMVGRYQRLVGPGSSMLVTLATGHPLARVMSLCAVYTRTTLGYSDPACDQLADLATFRPAVVVARSALLADVRDSARARALADDRVQVFDAAETVAAAYGRAMAGSGPSPALRLKHLVADRFVYPKLRATLGGRCVAVLCAGPADPRRAHLFRGIGIAVHDRFAESTP